MKVKRIKELIELLENSSVSEIEVKYFGGRGIRVAQKQAAEPARPSGGHIAPEQTVLSQITADPEFDTPKEGAAPEPESDLTEINSPIVGTFYNAPGPDEGPFVTRDSHISVGQVLCIIEAMKVMNEIKSDISGVVEEVCVKNAEPVEHGQVLFKIREG